MIWDFQVHGLLDCRRLFEVPISRKCQAMLDAINDNDFLWRPVHRVQLQRQENPSLGFVELDAYASMDAGQRH